MAKEFDTNEISLESLINETNQIMNSLVGNTTGSADDLIARVKANVEKCCESAQDCDTLLSRIQVEEDKYNNAIRRMKDAAVDCQDGKITKSQFGGIVTESATELKGTYNILTAGKADADSAQLSDENLKFTHDFLVGAKSAVVNRKAAIASESDTTIENFIKSLDNAGIANESIDSDTAAVVGIGVGMAAYIALLAALVSYKTPEEKMLWKKRRGEENKAANESLKQAKKAAKAKDYDKAITLYKEAIAQYNKLKEAINKVPNKVAAYDANNDNSNKMTPSYAKAEAINWCIDKVSACNNAIEDLKKAKEASAKKQAAKAEKTAAKDAGKAQKLADKDAKKTQKLSDKEAKAAAKDAAKAAKKANESLTEDALLDIYTACYESLIALECDATADPETNLDEAADDADATLADGINNLMEDAEVPEMFEEEDPDLDNLLEDEEDEE